MEGEYVYDCTDTTIDVIIYEYKEDVEDVFGEVN